MTRWQSVLAFPAFLIGLFGAAALLQHYAPAPRVPEFSDKLDHLLAHGGKIDTLFLGSSRVRRQISPRIFDETTAALGKPTHSFNFGLDGLGHPELPYVVDRILERKPRALREVVIELARFGREFNNVNPPDSLRAIHYHTYRYTWLLCRAVWRDPAHPAIAARLAGVAEHLGVCARRELNLGLGALKWMPASAGPDGLGPTKDGFFPVPQKFPPAKLAEYQRLLAAMASRKNAPIAHDPVFEEATETMFAKLRAQGIEITVVVMPRIFPEPPWVPQNGVHVIRFDDPEKEAALFDPAARYDAQHLNADGAKIFTQELARRFVQER